MIHSLENLSGEDLIFFNSQYSFIYLYIFKDPSIFLLSSSWFYTSRYLLRRKLGSEEDEPFSNRNLRFKT